jgi:hypothetical protein
MLGEARLSDQKIWRWCMTTATVATGLAAVSAVAAAISARSSHRAVTQAHTPFVWPSIAVRGPALGQHIIGVRLHNDGPGVAFNVRFAVVSDHQDYSEYAIAPIPAVRPGEQIPPVREPDPQVQPRIRDDAYEHPLPGGLDQSWWVLVRYSDALGRTWEIKAPLDPEGSIRSPSRLRSGLFDLWRSRILW